MELCNVPKSRDVPKSRNLCQPIRGTSGRHVSKAPRSPGRQNRARGVMTWVKEALLRAGRMGGAGRGAAEPRGPGEPSEEIPTVTTSPQALGCGRKPTKPVSVPAGVWALAARWGRRGETAERRSLSGMGDGGRSQLRINVPLCVPALTSPSRSPKRSKKRQRPFRPALIVVNSTLVVVVAVALVGCFIYFEPSFNFPVWHVPTTVTNFADLNTPYDDFNSAAQPVFGHDELLALSSNREERVTGNRIHLFQLYANFRRTSGAFNVSAKYYGRFPLAHQALQFGPLFLPLGGSPMRSTYPRGLAVDDSEALVFSGRTEAGDLDLMASEPFKYRSGPGRSILVIPATRDIQPRGMHHGGSPELAVTALSRLNRSGSDQTYASFGPDGRLYLASNHSGSFHIYAVKGGPIAGAAATGADWVAWLTEVGAPQAELEPVAALNSTSDDTAPSIIDGTMVFASNRPGGSGGYDLYWATYSARSGWSTPAAIEVANGPSNEFRPSLLAIGRNGSLPTYDNHFLLFSSDRRGGLGGYDMYYVGVVAPGLPVAQPVSASVQR